MFVAYPAYIRDKARQMRVERRMSLDEIAQRLALPKTTVWYWIRDLPLARPRRANPGQQLGNAVMSENYRRRREAAYTEGLATYAEHSQDPTFQHFVCLYLAEGYKRDRNVVSICNSDPAIIKMSTVWIRRETRNKVWFQVQYHADQDPGELRRFWGAEVAAEPSAIRLQRKSNSSGLASRTWRCEHGVLTAGSNDTYFRARLQAWMDCIRESWA